MYFIDLSSRWRRDGNHIESAQQRQFARCVTLARGVRLAAALPAFYLP
jgi:hypothetical protein